MVGILTNFKPLLNWLAAKPQTSPVIPPPTEITQSSLEKFLFNKISKILFTLIIFLLISLALKKWIKNFFLFKDLIIFETNFFKYLKIKNS